MSIQAVPTRPADVVVIGAGLVGTSVARCLARTGRSIVLLDSAGTGAGASGAAFGWISPTFASYMLGYPEFHMSLMARAIKSYSTIEAAFGEQIEYERTVGLTLVYSEDEVAGKSGQLRGLVDRGMDVRVVPRERVLELEPQLCGAFIGAVASYVDGLVNPLLMMRALAADARAHGAEILSGVQATGFVIRRGRIAGVKTSAGNIATANVVNAAGLGAVKLSAMVRVRIPLYADRGQQLVLHGPPHLVHSPVHGTGLIRPTKAGTYIVGATREPGEESVNITFAAMRSLARGVAAMLPNASDYVVTRAFAGLRPVPADGLPILGPTSRMEGFYLAVLHAGVTLAPVVGEIIRDFLAGDAQPDLAPYSPDRFAPGPP